MKKILFDLKKQYYFNSLYPLYRVLKQDPRYDLWIRSGKDQHRYLGIFMVSNREKIQDELRSRGFQVTDRTAGFDGVVCGDALKKPEKYGDVPKFHLDHGVGIKTLRIRNIVRQKNARYHVFLEGQYWYDYVKSLGYENSADFHVTGLPKLDPFFQPGHFDNPSLISRLGLDPRKKTVLFAPSYKPSCIDHIGDSILKLLPEYNLVVKLHPYSWGGKYAPHSQHRLYQELAGKHREMFLVPADEYDVYPYLFLADTLISDTSSVVNEFLALGKHGIIYQLPQGNPRHSDGMPVLSIDPEEWLKGAFPHISSPDQLQSAVESALFPSPGMKQKLEEYRNYFFAGLDGKASERVKHCIDSVLLEDK
ncbi:MAG: CDP-glycerol glycerophosphotransferase family protein [Candidatus Fermentibacteraceae bacterium]|nr:CDP-glycerol glycerophosphotransferase family protein [Candidatus Fermentibacteraceae bacterium]